jgi:hypothetical protein
MSPPRSAERPSPPRPLPASTLSLVVLPAVEVATPAFRGRWHSSCGRRWSSRVPNRSGEPHPERATGSRGSGEPHPKRAAGSINLLSPTRSMELAAMSPASPTPSGQLVAADPVSPTAERWIQQTPPQSSGSTRQRPFLTPTADPESGGSVLPPAGVDHAPNYLLARPTSAAPASTSRHGLSCCRCWIF